MIFTGQYKVVSEKVFINDLSKQQGLEVRTKSKSTLDMGAPFKSAWRGLCGFVSNPMVKLIAGVMLAHAAVIYLLVN